MKILFDHQLPFMLAHGGLQIQIERTKESLEKIGTEVEYVQWWNASQSGQVIHFFGRPQSSYIESAHAKGIRVVMSELLGGLGARPPLSRVIQRALISSSRKILPSPFTAKLAWESYKIADAVIALTSYEADLMTKMFDAAPQKVHVVPNGVEAVFFDSPEVERGKWLICAATITERKRVLEVARAAIAAGTPLWVIGRPYADAAPYFKQLHDLCLKNSQVLKYEGAIEDRARLAGIYREARGFVLLSTMESLSLSALEAAACGCPLLLSDLAWARGVFGSGASYCSVRASTTGTASALRVFYESAPTLPLPEKPKMWIDIARDLQQIYELVCKTSR
jgi:glycosyltransferase involved in cell wall biosynthesis